MEGTDDVCGVCIPYISYGVNAWGAPVEGRSSHGEAWRSSTCNCQAWRLATATLLDDCPFQPFGRPHRGDWAVAISAGRPSLRELSSPTTPEGRTRIRVRTSATLNPRGGVEVFLYIHMYICTYIGMYSVLRTFPSIAGGSSPSRGGTRPMRTWR